MATKYEYGSGNTTYSPIYGDEFDGQSFTIGTTGTNENFNLYSLVVRVFKKGTPPNIIISFRAVGGDGKPTGSDLISKEFDLSYVTTSTAGENVELFFDDELSFLASGKYCFICQPNGATSSDCYGFRVGSASSYLGGAFVYSLDNGVNWETPIPYDFYLNFKNTYICMCM